MSQFLRAAVPLVILVTSVLAPRAAWAESSGAVSPATVQHVVVREVGEMVEVEIQTSAPLVPNTQVITGPDRIVVDFPGATPSDQLRALKVNRGTLRGVRSGLFFNDPPITRVVLDLTGPQAYHISNTGNVTVVKFARGAAEEFADEQPKPRLQEAALDSHRAHLSTASVAVSVPAHVAGA